MLRYIKGATVHEVLTQTSATSVVKAIMFKDCCGNKLYIRVLLFVIILEEEETMTQTVTYELNHS